jgi:hypothetical protein
VISGEKDRLDHHCSKVELSKEVREREKGKKGADVKAGREEICSLVSCAGGREPEGVLVDFGVDTRPRPTQ